jgi:uncharacterized membrane protein (DUF2068 family)
MAEKPKKAAVPAKKTAPTLYIIAGFKIFKGVLLLIFAVTLFAMAKQDLPEIFDKIVSWFHLDPENKFFSSVSDWLGEVTPAHMRRFAELPFGYGLFLSASGIGLALRAKWAIWLAIGESAFFIPIEIYELIRRRSPDAENHRTLLAIILACNIIIVWYLYRNRDRLFRHHG